MPISHKYKCIFVHIPKNAGTSIINEFQMKDGGHYTWHQIKRNYPKEWETYFKFTVVRNPYDRFVSGYNYARMERSYWHSADGKTGYGKHEEYDLLKDKSFEECCELFFKSRNKFQNHCWGQQHPYICNNEGKIMVDYVVRYENFENDMKYVYKMCNKQPSPRYDNKSIRNRNYLDYYRPTKLNGSHKDLIHSCYKKDFEIFNYS